MESINALDFSLVLACYNEEAVFEKSVEKILAVLDNTRFSYELIFVDDCSRDRTRSLIDSLLASDKSHRLSKIFHTKNTGRGGAVADGFRAAAGEIVAYIDIDLEVPAHYVPVLLTEIKNGFDLVTAHRIYHFYWRSLGRWLMSHGYKWLVGKLLSLPFKDTETGFKFFRHEKILPLLDEITDQGWFWDTEVMARSYLKDYRILEFPCLFQRRFDKVSTVKPFADSVDYFRKLWPFRKTLKRLRAQKAALVSGTSRLEQLCKA